MKKISFTALLCMLVFSLTAQVIEKTYTFNEPVIEKVNGYDVVTFDQTGQTGEVGKPSLPWKTVSLLLPQNSAAQDVEIIFSDFTELEGEYILLPRQEVRPVSSQEPFVFAKDEAAYRMTTEYPDNAKGDLSTQYLNGCSFAFAGFTPVRYIAASGKVSYAKKVTVRVSITAAKDDKSSMLWLTPEVRARVSRLADNPEAIESYNTRAKTANGYELLVITPQEWVSHFDEYKEFYNARGLRTRVTALEDILSTSTGRDDPEKMREYIKAEYENNGILMVLLGGDSKLVPYRGLYCYVSEGYVDENIPADMYFVCLDGTWNDNDNNLWGEIDEADLLPELAIARMPFNDETQFNNMMHKTLEYQSNPVLGEFRTVVMGAEWLDDTFCGSNDLEALIGSCDDHGYFTVGIPEDYDFQRVYADENNWSGKNFRDRINAVGGQYTHHVGHANTDYVAGWYVSSTDDNSFAKLNGVDHNYNFFHSHGCICGDFTSTCMLERLVNISTGYVAATGNSRYGWYMAFGDGPARHLHREFVDSYYNDRLPYIGTAFVEMKIMTAPYVSSGWGDNGALRWNIYAINILGDVAVCPWLDEPFTPEVYYPTAILVGSTEASVKINCNSDNKNNFRCSLMRGDELVAFGITDENGNAALDFFSPLEGTEPLSLIVTGPNAYPQTFEVNTLQEGIAYVYASDIVLNDDNAIPEYGETINLNINFYNAGTINADNTSVTLSTDCEYVTITNDNAEIGNIDAESSVEMNDAFTLVIADNVPDNTYADFTITCSSGNNRWTQHFNMRLYAPVLKISEATYAEQQGDMNGYLDPSEVVRISVSGKNTSKSAASDVILRASCDSEWISFETNDIQIGTLEENDTFNEYLDFIIDNNAPNGEILNIDIEVIAGEYSVTKAMRLSIGALKETFESGDFSFLEWQFDYDLPWVISDEESHDGRYSAASGAIGDDEISSLIIDIQTEAAGDISFFFKTDTERNKDFLVFYIDGQLMDLWSGDNDWQNVSFTIDAGQHILEWRYDKSPNGAAGRDRCWIDDVLFPGSSQILNVTTVTESEQTRVYPNPANDRIMILGNDIKVIEIYNAFGMLMTSQNNGDNVIDVSNLTPGLYLVRTADKNGKVNITKVIKR